jgi:hypothetical protein
MGICRSAANVAPLESPVPSGDRTPAHASRRPAIYGRLIYRCASGEVDSSSLAAPDPGGRLSQPGDTGAAVIVEPKPAALPPALPADIRVSVRVAGERLYRRTARIGGSS